ncbi:MAG TPA: HAD-IA family hydrolase [Acidimicrobiia bacterium]|jgi:putative hydrolase of the HAD superfamily|nr:HAD-IA family hydrolase [Acidimicrobiia bacterium]
MYRAVIFDLGGVVFPSPFEAFDAHDRDAGFPAGTVRAIIRTSSETGAWAALERGELTLPDFHSELEAEALEVGFELDAAKLMATVAGGFGPRPAMTTAIRRIRESNLRTAALTNNWPRPEGGVQFPPTGDGLGFDVVIESAVVGLRKPDPRIYELVLSKLGVDATEAVFLDDLGINLKPARAMGMTTIKVIDPDRALDELADVLGFEVR